MKRIMFLSLTATLLLSSGCQFYRPGQISQKIFGGLSSDGAVVSVPTPWGRAVRIGTTTNQVVVYPDGTIAINGTIN